MARLKSTQEKETITLKALHKLSLDDSGRSYEVGELFEYPLEKWNKIVEEAKLHNSIPYFAIPVED
jgi:hypothetical protein